MTDFFERAEPVFELYAQGNYAEALRVVDELAREFPERSVNTAYWKVCLLAVSGQKEAALRAMEQAVSEGLWWSEERLRMEPDVKDLQGEPGFERLVAVCAKRHASANAHTEPELLILEPHVENTTRYPLLMVFHGRDGSAEREKHHWKSACDLGWLVALAQSSQTGSLNSYVWDDTELAHQETLEHFKLLQQRYSLDAHRIVLGGFSQGAAIALMAAVRGNVPVTAFIAVAPGRIVNLEELPALAGSARGRGLNGVIVAGKKDPRFEVSVQISETLSTYGIACRLETRPDLGHAYPSDFKDMMQTTLQSILKEQE